jgi:hypothetical protein
MMTTTIATLFLRRRLGQRWLVRLALLRRRRRARARLWRPPQAPPGLLLNNHLRRDIGLPPVNDSGFGP